MVANESRSSISFFVPEQKFLLEEANLPANVIERIAGQSVFVETCPEEPPATRRVQPDDFPFLMDRVGNYWNAFRPIRVLFTDQQGQVWRFPRRWLPMLRPIAEPCQDSTGTVWQEATFSETLNLPTAWDLWEINIPWERCQRVEGRPAQVEVSIRPGEQAKVFWRDSTGTVWRIPHDWRRRLIKLPNQKTLASQDMPVDVAEKYAEQIVSVNYHPGSRCCFPDRYRFRDASGNRYPVRIADCMVIGYGDSATSDIECKPQVEGRLESAQMTGPEPRDVKPKVPSAKKAELGRWPLVSEIAMHLGQDWKVDAAGLQKLGFSAGKVSGPRDMRLFFIARADNLDPCMERGCPPLGWLRVDGRMQLTDNDLEAEVSILLSDSLSAEQMASEITSRLLPVYAGFLGVVAELGLKTKDD
jgi:hypothetical protein